MNAKEYLSQAYRIDQRINSKLEQVMSLRALLGKATGTLTGAPKAATPNPQSMEDTICKMVDMENEINADIDTLVDLKAKIMTCIITQLTDAEDVISQIKRARTFKKRLITVLYQRTLCLCVGCGEVQRNDP